MDIIPSVGAARSSSIDHFRGRRYVTFASDLYSVLIMAALAEAWLGCKTVFMRVVHAIGTFNAYIIFGALYIVGIGLYAIPRLILRSFVDISKIGWKEKEKEEPDHSIENLRRQF